MSVKRAPNKVTEITRPEPATPEAPKPQIATPRVQAEKGRVYCPMCTHTVDAMVTLTLRDARVQAGQRCSRCQSSLDAAYVVRVDRAA
jgi:transposase-like protein